MSNNLYIIVVMQPNGEYDCILDNLVYPDRQSAYDARAMAKNQDRMRGEEYKYRVVSVNLREKQNG